jgi:hypothetical protein
MRPAFFQWLGAKIVVCVARHQQDCQKSAYRPYVFVTLLNKSVFVLLPLQPFPYKLSTPKVLTKQRCLTTLRSICILEEESDNSNSSSIKYTHELHFLVLVVAMDEPDLRKYLTTLTKRLKPQFEERRKEQQKVEGEVDNDDRDAERRIAIVCQQPGKKRDSQVVFYLSFPSHVLVEMCFQKIILFQIYFSTKSTSQN